MNQHHKRTIRLSGDAELILKSVGDADSYLSRILVRHETAWRDARALALGCGWSDEEIIASIAALNGTRINRYTGGLPARVALDLHDYSARLGGLEDAHVDIEPETWQSRVEQVRKHDGLALALSDLADEYWAGNASLRATLEAGAEPSVQPANHAQIDAE